MIYQVDFVVQLPSRRKVTRSALDGVVDQTWTLGRPDSGRGEYRNLNVQISVDAVDHATGEGGDGRGIIPRKRLIFHRSRINHMVVPRRETDRCLEGFRRIVDLVISANRHGCE